MLFVAACGAAEAVVTTPITATVTRTTYEVDADGKTTLVSQQSGTFRRASDGSEVTIMLDPGVNRTSTEVSVSKGRRVVVERFHKHYAVRPAGRFAPSRFHRCRVTRWSRRQSTVSTR